MSLLSTKIRKVIGKGSSCTGRGMRWMYVTGSCDDRGRATVSENEEVINKLISNFETYKLVQKHNVQFISFIYNTKTGNYIGSCKISRWSEGTDERMIVVDYTSVDKETILESVTTCKGFTSFEKVSL